MSVRNKKVEHIYHDYNLYAATYSRSPSYKLGEALGALFVMNELKNIDPKSFSSFSVLEILAGQSEHKQYMFDHANSDVHISEYSYLDSEGDPAQGVIKGDVLTTNLKDNNFNFIIGYFFSASSVMDLTGAHRSAHARSVVAKLFENMYNNLPEVGAFVLDFAENGYENSLYATKGTEEETFDVPFYHALRQEYDIPAHGKCEVVVHRKATYDRRTSTVTDEFTKPVLIKYAGETVARVHVKQAMTQRYFSETELSDMAIDAGFTKLMFLQNEYSENDYTLLDNVIDLEDEEEIDESVVANFMPNMIVAIKGIQDD